jgi:hypothetical protein
VKLFQIEEPEGGPADADAPGAAIGIDLSGVAAEAAVAVGGNAVLLADRSGYERLLRVPGLGEAVPMWRTLFEGVRLRAERALARPVTHAVVVLASTPDEAAAAGVQRAAREAGLDILRIVQPAALPPGATGALGAAVLAEDLGPAPPLADLR